MRQAVCVRASKVGPEEPGRSWPSMVARLWRTNSLPGNSLSLARANTPPANSTHKARLTVAAGPAKAPTAASSLTSPAPRARSSHIGRNISRPVSAPNRESHRPSAPGCAEKTPVRASLAVSARFRKMPAINVTSTSTLGTRRCRASDQTASASNMPSAIRAVDCQPSGDRFPVMSDSLDSTWYLFWFPILVAGSAGRLREHGRPSCLAVNSAAACTYGLQQRARPDGPDTAVVQAGGSQRPQDGQCNQGHQKRILNRRHASVVSVCFA
jgi:hypothetical protein